MAKILGIDYGAVRVGLAMTDSTNTIATGLDTLVVNGNLDILINKLKEILSENSIETIVIGYPKNMDGTISKKALEIDKIIEELKKLNVKVEKWDERLTTVMAYGTMRELGIKQKEKNKFADKLAATTILQDYLKYINR